MPAADIEAFARLVGEHPRTFFRLGYGFARQRNGAVNMHAASCIPVLTGAWQHPGGGAFHNNGAIFHWNRTLIDGLDVRDPAVRMLDQSRIGPVLCGEADALDGFRCCEGAEGFDVAPVEGGLFADLVRDEVAFFGRDLFKGGDVVGRAFLPPVVVENHRLLEAGVGC